MDKSWVVVIIEMQGENVQFDDPNDVQWNQVVGIALVSIQDVS